MGPTVDDCVDLGRYPVLDPDGPVLATVVADARAQLVDSGAVELAGFLTPAGIAALVADADALAPRAHHSSGEGTAYLEFPDFSLPEDHPRLTWGHYAVGAVPYDLMPADVAAPAALRVGAAAGAGGGRPRPGSGLPLRRPVRRTQPGRHARGRRAAVALRPDRLRGVARHPDGRPRAGTSRSSPASGRPRTSATTTWPTPSPAPGPGVVTLPMVPGTLLIFEGRHSLHRVSPVGSGLARHVGLLAYDTEPGTAGQRPAPPGPLRPHRALRHAPGRLAAGVSTVRPVDGFVTQIGEAFVGSGPEAAHLNTVLGAKGGPVETAWVTALATPRAGHAAFLTTVRPGVPAKPMTLFVNKATLEGDRHSTMTWGPAQAGVASGVLWAVADGIVERRPRRRPGADRRGVGQPRWPPTRRSSTTTTVRPPGTRWPPGRRGPRRSPRPSSTATGRSTPTTCHPG